MSHSIRHAAIAALVGLASFGAQAANVLIVLSDEARLELRDKRIFETGFYANELMQPVKKLLDAGHTLTFATPPGKAPTVDRSSLESALEQPAPFIQRLETGAAAGKAPAWIYAGYRMTVISNQEEEAAKGALNGGQMKFTPQTALQRAGGRYGAAPNWNANVVQDRELITGQNPASALDVADALLARLPAASAAR